MSLAPAASAAIRKPVAAWHWFPLAILPLLAATLTAGWPAWVFMWALSFAIFSSLKWLTYADYCIEAGAPPLNRAVSYLILWPGMDADAFFDTTHHVPRPARREWLIGPANVLLGIALVAFAVNIIEQHHVAAAWLGMAGIVFILHFGIFRIISVAWRLAGIQAQPIMDAPIRATSLSEFWGKRWNLALRDLAHAYVFKLLAGRIGIAGATLSVFLVSGLVHDAVISTPARAGFGLPTLYFLLQGCGVLLERSRLGKSIRLRGSIGGRIFCAIVLLLPAPLLFHPPFIERVVLPMLAAIGQLSH